LTWLSKEIISKQAEHNLLATCKGHINDRFTAVDSTPPLADQQI